MNARQQPAPLAGFAATSPKMERARENAAEMPPSGNQPIRKGRTIRPLTDRYGPYKQRQNAIRVASTLDQS